MLFGVFAIHTLSGSKIADHDNFEQNREWGRATQTIDFGLPSFSGSDHQLL